MKSLLTGILAVIALTCSVPLLAGGLSYRVESLQKAKEMCKAEPAKHILIYYTNNRS